MDQGHNYPYNPRFPTNPRPSSSSPASSLYPRIGQPGEPAIIPPIAAGGPPYNRIPSSSGHQIKVAIKNEYRITLPPQLATSVCDIQLSSFSFDFDLEKKILAETETENPNWSQFMLENMSSTLAESVHSVIGEELPPLSRISLDQSFKSKEEASDSEASGSQKSSKFRTARYAFVADGENELDLMAGEEVEVQYKVDGWYYVKKKRPGKDGKMEGLVPVLYVG